MIDKKFALRQVARLEALPFFPRGEAGVEELVRALQQAARSDKHATDIIDEFCGSTCDEPRSPTPAEIIRTGWNLLGEQKPAYCDRCNGLGVLITDHGDGITSARPCPCRLKPNAPEAPKPPTTLHRADPRMLAAGGQE